MTLNNRLPQNRKAFALALAVFGLYLFYMLSQVNFYLYRSLRETYYLVLVPVVVAGTLYFFRGKQLAYRLLLGYWIWFVLSRMLNHNLALTEDQYLWFDLSLMLPFFALGLVLDADGRRRFLDWLSAAVGGYHFILGLFALSAFILNKYYVNPITEGHLGMIPGSRRITILDYNANSTAFWFMTAFLLMVYQFFACRKKAWRWPIVLCALVNFATVAVTYTRSVRIALTITLAMLASLAVRRHARVNRRLLILLLVLIFLASAALVYLSFGLITYTLTHLPFSAAASELQVSSGAALRGARPFPAEAVPLRAVSPGAEEAMLPDIGDPSTHSALYNRINDLSTKRLEIYHCALLTIREDPMILLRGCLSKDAMSVTNAILHRPETIAHFHNFLIQTLILTGLPGLLLALAFCVLIVGKGLKLFFSPDPRLSTGVRTLALSPIAAILYAMFESCLFTDLDIRCLFFFLMSGLMLGSYHDFFPETE